VKRKILRNMISIILLSIPLLGCTIREGHSYQKYYWVYEPLYIYDTNPYTPNTIYNDEYYYVEAGSYYMEYDAWDGSGWYMYYTIKEDKGILFDDGDDYFYEIDLYSSGPSLYRYIVEKNINNEKEERDKVSTIEDNKIVREIKRTEREKGPIIGSEEIKVKNRTIKIEYGRML